MDGKNGWKRNMKTCEKCGKEFEPAYRHPYQKRCKVCGIIRQKETARKANRKYRENHHERCIESSKKFRENNPEKYREILY